MSEFAGRKTLSITEAKEVAGVSIRTIYNWMEAEKIEFVRTASGSVRIFEDTLFRKADGTSLKTDEPMIHLESQAEHRKRIGI